MDVQSDILINFKTILKQLSAKLNCFLVVIVVFLLMMTVVTVSYGTVGVVTRFGAVTDNVFYPGIHFKIPFVDGVLTYNTQKVTYETSDNPDTSEANYTDFAIDTTTKDGQQISIRYTIRFSVDPDRVKWVANNLGNEQAIVEKIIKTDSRTYVRNIPREFNAEQLYTGNVVEVQQQIFDTLAPKFEENGLILDSFGIRQIGFEQEYIDAIEAKQIAKEGVTTQKHLAEREEYKKQQQITKAQGEAEAQRLQQQTLTPLLIQKQYLEKWDGKLPQYSCSDGNLIFDMTN